MWNESTSDWTVMKEDFQKVCRLVDALMALMGVLGSTSENVPPPDNPNGCLVS